MSYLTNNWAEILTNEYKEGASDIEVMDVLGISKQVFDSQYKDNPVFRELVDIGRLAQTAFWYRVGRKNLKDRSFNNAVWMFNMKNRFGWAEKSESTVAGAPENQLTLEEMQAKLQAKVPGILKRLGVNMKEADILKFPVEDTADE